MLASKESHLNHNKGEGLNADHEGLIVSCGTFNTLPGSNDCDNGVVMKLAADTLEVAGEIEMNILFRAMMILCTACI